MSGLKHRELRGEIFLTITALIWGTSFVAQKVSMDYIGPFTFGASRFILGALVLLPVALVMRGSETRRHAPRSTLIGGVACGLALFVAASLQQVGIVHTTAGKAGFITTLYIILVPLFGYFLHKRVRSLVWMGVALAVVGLYLLTIKEGFTIQNGDLIVLIGAIFWALHILIIDHFAPMVDGLTMSLIQFLVTGLLSAGAALITETPSIAAIVSGALPILYTAIVVVGVAYTFQIIGQKNTDPTIASIILSMESVFAVISGTLLLGEVMSAKEIAGCILMFTAVIMTQLPQRDTAQR